MHDEDLLIIIGQLNSALSLFEAGELAAAWEVLGEIETETRITEEVEEDVG